MKDNQINLYGLLERLPTEQLDEMLQAELQKEAVDENAVRVILRVLREREAEMPVEVDEAAERAWAQYSAETPLVHHSVKNWGWVWRVATVAAILGAVLLVAPTTANAERVFGMLTRWTDSILEFFDPNDKDTNSVVYEFKTDNPGLQQVYDAVVELGVTDPVVPMWIPEGYEFLECKMTSTPRKKSVVYNFSSGQDFFVIQLDVHEDQVARMYQKNDGNVETYEYNGVAHMVIKNQDLWTVIWSRDYVECFITINCQKDVLQKILRSIYDGGVL